LPGVPARGRRSRRAIALESLIVAGLPAVAPLHAARASTMVLIIVVTYIVPL
jgi:hypothetical protein